MRSSRFLMLAFGAAALVACGEDDITTPELPPLSQVRFINAVSDVDTSGRRTGGIDVRAIDQVALSPVANNLAFRASTIYFPTEAGVRRLRAFQTSTDAAVTSVPIFDGAITLPAGRRFTLLIAGSQRNNTVNLWLIDDTPPAIGADQIAVRLVNASGGVIDGYAVATATTALPASPSFSNLGLFTTSSYALRTAGPAAVRVTDAGTTSVRASLAGPAGPAALPGALPPAGVGNAGTAFSAYFFGPGAPGSAYATVTAPGIVWFVDKNPCDEPKATACTI